MFYTSAEKFKEKNGYVIDGFWYPRVTSIVNIKSKPGLYYFYASMENFAAGERVKKKSATEGTLVHEAIEKIFIGEKPEVPSSIEPSIRAFLNFLNETSIQVDPTLIEKRIINYEDRYAGTLDAVALINGKLGILDIKTSQEIFRDYNLQTAAYMAAMKDQTKDIQTRWILRIDQSRPCIKCGAALRSKGGRDKIKIQWNNYAMRKCEHEWDEIKGYVELKEFPYWENDFYAFIGAKKLWEWENENWLKQINYF